MSGTATPVLRIYYAATAVFLLLDYALNINVRLAFLDAWPGWRALYYLGCFGCLGLIVWRPALTTWVTSVESLLTLSMLIVAMGVRVMSVTDEVLETGRGIVSAEEIANFLIAGSAAWYSWLRGSQQLGRELRRR